MLDKIEQDRGNDIRGRETWPVTSFEGAIGVLLYGIVTEYDGSAATVLYVFWYM